MTLGPLLLLLSALLHAAWNGLAKASKDKESFLFLTILLSGLLTAVSLPISGTGFIFPDNRAFAIAVLSGIFEGFYFLTLSKALRASSLGKSYAIMRGGAMVLVWLYSTVLLGERAHGLQFLGAVFVLLGILAMNFQDLLKGKRQSLKNDIWAYISAVFIAGYHLAYHEALTENTDPKPLFLVAMVVSLPFLLYGIRSAPWPRIKATMTSHPVRVLLCGTFATASFLIFLYGLKVSAPGFAISLRNSSIFFAVVFSVFLKESLTRTQILGATTIGLGALLLSL
ncbi:DMT family transporter [Bdellovibrio bacteriovorus]|uniref:Multidrug DMT transporter permease n=1 Tax=Bdellovibrio bacteriovorus TaxID=959 RepID=A0A1Z3N7U1_BDEBC|nr:DMT family transporter [Bdellovibrio bacteriovorus]ASD63516.1 multidrug DMT transporter permease [Bdellovibrio bacteriovorus]